MAEQRDGFVLVTSLYNETHEERLTEYRECLIRNLACELIDQVVVFYDTARDSPGSAIFELLRSRPLRIELIESRPTFERIFQFVNEQFTPRRVMVANADIYFDATLALLDDFALEDRFLCLSRREVDRDGCVYYQPHSCSQDVWIFQTPLRQFPAAIPIGLLGSESRLAWEAARAGLAVLNPSRTIAAFHLHSSGIRNYTEASRQQGAYRMVASTELPWPVSQSTDGEIWAPACRACIQGEELRYEVAGSNLGFWANPDDSIWWEVALQRPGRMEVELAYAAPPDSSGSRFALSFAGYELTGRVEPTGSWSQYVTRPLGTVEVSRPGRYPLALRALSSPGHAVMNLRSIRLKRSRDG